MATFVINSTAEQEYVESSVTESYLRKIDEHTAFGGVHDQITQPADEFYFQWAQDNIQASNARPPEQRTNYEIFSRVFVENEGFSAYINQFNIIDAVRTVELKIPIADLPSLYTEADILTWGRNQNLLRNESDIY
jgi:hypothetical protein